MANLLLKWGIFAKRCKTQYLQQNAKAESRVVKQTKKDMHMVIRHGTKLRRMST
jgi:hypothetical protein